MHNCLTPRRLRQTFVPFVFFLFLLTSLKGSFAQEPKAAVENTTVAAPIVSAGRAIESATAAGMTSVRVLQPLERMALK